MELQVPQLNAAIFTHIPGEKKLVAEHSTARNISFSSLLYDDACDTGIQVFNPKKGTVTRWYLADQEYAGSGSDRELQATVFKPCPETERKHPETKGYSIVLFND